MLATDPIEVALLVARRLVALDVRYLVGGSLASSISGELRSTLDIDMVVALTEEQMARRQRFRVATEPDRYLYLPLVATSCR